MIALESNVHYNFCLIKYTRLSSSTSIRPSFTSLHEFINFVHNFPIVLSINPSVIFFVFSSSKLVPTTHVQPLLRHRLILIIFNTLYANSLDAVAGKQWEQRFRHKFIQRYIRRWLHRIFPYITKDSWNLSIDPRRRPDIV